MKSSSSVFSGLCVSVKKRCPDSKISIWCEFWSWFHLFQKIKASLSIILHKQHATKHASSNRSCWKVYKTCHRSISFPFHFKFLTIAFLVLLSDLMFGAFWPKHNASTVQPFVCRNFPPRSVLLRHSCGEATRRSKTMSFGVEGLERLQNSQILRNFGCIFSRSLQNPRKSLKRTWHKISLFPDSFMPLSKRHIAGQVGRSQGFSGVSWNRRWRWHRRWHWWGWDGRGRRSWTCHWGLPKFGSQWMQLPSWDAYGCGQVWFLSDSLMICDS